MKRDYYSQKAIKELEELWGGPYRWEDEYEKYIKGDLDPVIKSYYEKTKDYNIDIYAINFDHAGIGMEATFFRDGIYPMPKNKNILDIGCGYGAFLRCVEPENKLVVGIDIGMKGFEKCKDLIDKRAMFLYLDVSRERIPFADNTFDIVNFTETIEHIDNPFWTISEAKRVMKDNGHLITTFPEQEDQAGAWGGQHAHLYPGLFRRCDFRMFMMQLFFKLIHYSENGGTGKFIFKNIKERYVNPYCIAKGDFKSNLVYERIRNWDEDLEQPIPSHPHNTQLSPGEQKPRFTIDSRIDMKEEFGWVSDADANEPPKIDF